ncbi:MAG TPA: prepilin peptidase [Planctomycetota bacterium]|nr:prepilin peptidase [Planctomycetota bacterium]
MTDIVGQITGAVLGACVGSFLNVVIWRLPRGTFLADGKRSICPNCREPIPWYRNVPIVSWLVLRGRAPCCGARIAVRYVLVEAVTALLFWALVVRPPSGLVAWPPNWPGSGAFVLHAYFVSTLIACTVIDIDHRILPDRLTKPGMVVGVLGSFVVAEAYGRLAVRASPTAQAVLFSAAGLLAGFALTWSVRQLATLLFRKEAMGRGDVKFMGAIGAFVGWQDVLLTFFLACLYGAAGGLLHRAVTGQAYVWFGPFLAAGAVTALFFGESVMHFLFVTWPQWQESHPVAPVLILSGAAAVLLLLFFVIRRGA